MKVEDVLDELRERPGTGDVIPIINPATEEQFSEFTDGGAEAVDDAVARAKASAESGVWKDCADYDRAKVLWRVGELIDQNAENWPNSNRSTPACLRLRRTRWSPASEWFRYYAGWCTKIDGIARDITTGGSDRRRLTHAHLHAQEPYDVVGLIFPWNGPSFNFCAKLAPRWLRAAAASSSPPRRPHCQRCVERILAEAGVPDGVVNLVNG